MASADVQSTTATIQSPGSKRAQDELATAPWIDVWNDGRVGLTPQQYGGVRGYIIRYEGIRNYIEDHFETRREVLGLKYTMERMKEQHRRELDAANAAADDARREADAAKADAAEARKEVEQVKEQARREHKQVLDDKDQEHREEKNRIMAHAESQHSQAIHNASQQAQKLQQENDMLRQRVEAAEAAGRQLPVLQGQVEGERAAHASTTTALKQAQSELAAARVQTMNDSASHSAQVEYLSRLLKAEKDNQHNTQQALAAAKGQLGADAAAQEIDRLRKTLSAYEKILESSKDYEEIRDERDKLRDALVEEHEKLNERNNELEREIERLREILQENDEQVDNMLDNEEKLHREKRKLHQKAEKLQTENTDLKTAAITDEISNLFK